jgi:aminobenzoyl-glutamate utilization protein B
MTRKRHEGHAPHPPREAPAIELNRTIRDRFRPEMKKSYYDPSRYRTCLEQLGIAYPTLRPAASPGQL